MNSTLARWTPSDIWNEFDSFLEPLKSSTILKTGSFDVDVYEDENQWVVEASLPGINKDNISIDVDSGLLEISVDQAGEHIEEKADYVIRERSRGKLARMFRLPRGIDTDEPAAELKDGVLKLVFSKTKKNKITIK